MAAESRPSLREGTSYSSLAMAMHLKGGRLGRLGRFPAMATAGRDYSDIRNCPTLVRGRAACPAGRVMAFFEAQAGLGVHQVNEVADAKVAFEVGFLGFC